MVNYTQLIHSCSFAYFRHISRHGNDRSTCSLVCNWMQVIALFLSLSLSLARSQTFRQCLSVLSWSHGGMSSLSRNPSSGKRAHLARVNWLRARNILSVTEWPSFERGKAARLTHLGAKQAETMVGPSVSGYARARNIGARVTDREITRGKIKSWNLALLKLRYMGGLSIWFSIVI